MVRIQAHTMRPATPQCTARLLRIEPMPTIAPAMVCVVETGMPRAEAEKMVTAPAVSAAKPPMGMSLVILLPMVWTMRQPPESVPEAMAACAISTIQKGMIKCPEGSTTR